MRDPCEYTDVAASHPDVMAILKARLQDYIDTAVPPRNKPWDPLANPKYWGYTWNNWLDYPPPVELQVDGSVTQTAFANDIYGDMRPE